MQTLTQAEIEAKCLQRGRGVLGGGLLKAVRIKKTGNGGTGPNWQIDTILIDQHSDAAQQEIFEAIQPLRQEYALAD